MKTIEQINMTDSESYHETAVNEHYGDTKECSQCADERNEDGYKLRHFVLDKNLAGEHTIVLCIDCANKLKQLKNNDREEFEQQQYEEHELEMKIEDIVNQHWIELDDCNEENIAGIHLFDNEDEIVDIYIKKYNSQFIVDGQTASIFNNEFDDYAQAEINAKKEAKHQIKEILANEENLYKDFIEKYT